MPRGIRKQAKRVKQFSAEDVENAVEMDGVLTCPDCGKELAKATIVDYGYNEGDDGAWFIRQCSCGQHSKYFASLKVGEARRWTKRKPKPTTSTVKNLVIKKKPNPPEKKTPVVKEKPKEKLKRNWWEDDD